MDVEKREQIFRCKSESIFRDFENSNKSLREDFEIRRKDCETLLVPLKLGYKCSSLPSLWDNTLPTYCPVYKANDKLDSNDGKPIVTAEAEENSKTEVLEDIVQVDETQVAKCEQVNLHKDTIIADFQTNVDASDEIEITGKESSREADKNEKVENVNVFKNQGERTDNTKDIKFRNLDSVGDLDNIHSRSKSRSSTSNDDESDYASPRSFISTSDICETSNKVLLARKSLQYICLNENLQFDEDGTNSTCDIQLDSNKEIKCTKIENEDPPKSSDYVENLGVYVYSSSPRVEDSFLNNPIITLNDSTLSEESTEDETTNKINMSEREKSISAPELFNIKENVETCTEVQTESPSKGFKQESALEASTNLNRCSKRWTPDDIENYLMNCNFEENMRLGFVNTDDIELYEWKRSTGMSPICDTSWTRATLRKNKVIPSIIEDAPDILYPERLTPPIPPLRKRGRGNNAVKITEVECTSFGVEENIFGDEEEEERDVSFDALHSPTSNPNQDGGKKVSGHLAFRGFHLSKQRVADSLAKINTTAKNAANRSKSEDRKVNDVKKKDKEPTSPYKKIMQLLSKDPKTSPRSDGAGKIRPESENQDVPAYALFLRKQPTVST